MKKAVILLALFAFSCKRHYVCICEQETQWGNQVVSQHSIHATEKNADAECERFEDNTTCYPHR
jgi:hypothetical protein